MPTKTREYRIMRKKKGDLYYPQVREFVPFLLFWFRYSKWMRIARHVEGFGLYDDFERSCKSKEEAQKIIADYEEQFMDSEPVYPCEHESQAGVRWRIAKHKIGPRPVYKQPHYGEKSN